MKVSQITVILSLAVLSAFSQARAQVTPDPTLLGLSWFVHVCKNPGGSNDCTDNRKLTRGTRFRLHRDDNNNYWLNVQLQKPNVTPRETLMELTIPIEEIEWNNPQGGPPGVRFSFQDFDENGKIITSTMAVTLLRKAGESTTAKPCEESLYDYSGNDIPEAQRQEQCGSVNSSVVHWRIRSGPLFLPSGEDPPQVDALGPPGDGQGSGSDEPPN